MKGGVILEILLSRPHKCEFAIHTPGGFSAVRRAAAIDGVMRHDDGPASSESDEAADDLGVGRRTYYCQVDSEIDMNRWISAIANAPPPPEDGEDKGLETVIPAYDEKIDSELTVFHVLFISLFTGMLSIYTVTPCNKDFT